MSATDETTVAGDAPAESTALPDGGSSDAGAAGDDISSDTPPATSSVAADVDELERGQADDPTETAIAAAMADTPDVAGEADGDVDELADGDVDETDEGDPPPPDAPEEGLHPDEVAVLAAAQSAETLRQVESAGNSYIRKAIKLLGPTLGGYVVCQSCDGMLPGLINPELVTEERRDAVRVQYGFDTLEELKSDERYYVECGTCGGNGKLRTFSHVAKEAAKQCPDCKGKGWRAGPDLKPEAATATHVDEPELEPEVAVADEDGPDEYGTPRWHEDWGKMPHRRTVPVDHWRVNLPADAGV